MGRLKKVALAIVIIGLVALVIYLMQKRGTVGPLSNPISITSSSPANGESAVSVFDPIKITFNQDIDPLTLTVTSDPAENWNISPISKDSIKIDHKLYLKVATTYKLAILRHEEEIGTLTFETARDQNDPRQLQTLQTDLDTNYPLAKFTPYQTSNYMVVYSSPLTFEIDIKGVFDPQEAISEVQSWVKSHGVDPATHKYTVVSATPNP